MVGVYIYIYGYKTGIISFKIPIILLVIILSGHGNTVIDLYTLYIVIGNNNILFNHHQ